MRSCTRDRVVRSMLSLLKAIAIVSIAVFSFTVWHFYDVMWWLQWVVIAETKGILHVYEATKNPYLPLASLTFVGAYLAANYLGFTVSIDMLRFFLKMVMVVIPGLIIYRVIRKMRGELNALLWIIGAPFLSIVIALQFDVLIALFLTLSVLFLARRRFASSMLMLAISALYKPVTAIALPVYLMYMAVCGSNMKTLLRQLSVFVAVVLCVIMPFFMVSGEEFLRKAFEFHSNRYPQDLSIWALPVLLFGPYASLLEVLRWGWILPFVAMYIALMVYIKRRFSELSDKLQDFDSALRLLSLAVAMVLLVFIISSKIGNQNYVVWVYPLLLLAIDIKSFRNRDLLKIFAMPNLAVIAMGMYVVSLLVVPSLFGGYVYVVEDQGYLYVKTLYELSSNSTLLRIFKKSLEDILNTSISLSYPKQLLDIRNANIIRIYTAISALFIAQGANTALMLFLIKRFGRS